MKTKPSTEYVLLGLLMSGRKHGYEIMQLLESVLTSVWCVSTSQLYALLRRLEQNGFLESSIEPQDVRPSKRVFALTRAGQQVFLDWLYRPTPHVRDFRIEFIGKLFFFHHLSLGGAMELIDAQIETLRRQRAAIRKGEESAKDPFKKLVHGFKADTVECHIKWLSSKAKGFIATEVKRA
jgi:PadR family transcriptional regulator AphA